MVATDSPSSTSWLIVALLAVLTAYLHLLPVEGDKSAEAHQARNAVVRFVGPQLPGLSSVTSTSDLSPYFEPLNWECIGTRKLYFQMLHVPKAGGTTLVRNLVTHCKKEVNCVFCCQGHHMWSRLDFVASERVKNVSNCRQIIMSIRHPVDVVVSSFYESKAWLESPNADEPQCNHFECPTIASLDLMKNESFSLSDAIMYKPAPFYTRNKMSMFLADRPPTGRMRRGEVRNSELGKPSAYRRLGRGVDFLLIAERLAEGMRLLCAHYDLPLLRYFNQWDFNPYPKLPRSDPLWEEIARQNSVDMELYSEGVRLYERQKEHVLRRLNGRVPMNFTCERRQCTAAPPRCTSLCTRPYAWVDEAPPPEGEDAESAEETAPPRRGKL